jgi:putative phosphonate transport system ATP-binding protein
MKPVVRVRNLTKVYGEGCTACGETTGPARGTNVCARCGSVVACRDVSFDVFPREVLGVVGESGSGKSTVVKLLHFDMEPTAGELAISLNGRRGARERADDAPELAAALAGAGETNAFALSSYQKRLIRDTFVGMVYQHPYLGLRMGVSSGGNVAERLLMAGWRHVGRMRARASALLERTEVPVARMDEPPRNFSGGMQQRVQIAKALSTGPSLLLLDEVTSGLDVSVQARVLDLVRELQRELDVATVVVSHDLGVIRMLTTRTMVLKCGRIVESGLTDQVLEDPQDRYTQLLVSSVL